MQDTLVQSLHQEDLLEKEMATHSSVLAWRIPRTEEPGRLHPREYLYFIHFCSEVYFSSLTTLGLVCSFFFSFSRCEVRMYSWSFLFPNVRHLSPYTSLSERFLLHSIRFGMLFSIFVSLKIFLRLKRV